VKHGRCLILALSRGRSLVLIPLALSCILCQHVVSSLWNYFESGLLSCHYSVRSSLKSEVCFKEKGRDVVPLQCSDNSPSFTHLATDLARFRVITKWPILLRQKAFMSITALMDTTTSNTNTALGCFGDHRN
jgi:hypothetical protein